MATEIIYYRSPLGILEIRSDEDAITHLLFVNSMKGKKVDESELQYDLPKLPITKECIKQLEEYFEGKRTIFDLHIELAGTDFRKKVWQALLNIPYGKTISYMQLSKNIGDVKAIRAVGTANGANPVSIIVPCHRVIGSNGDLTGYGGDLWRKKWLLEHEAKYGNGVQTLFLL